MKNYAIKILFYFFLLFFSFGGLFLKAESQSFESKLDEARKAFISQEYTAAITIWSKIINSEASKEVKNEALMNRAKVYLLISQPSLALIDINNVKDFSSKYKFEIRLLRGIIYIQLENYKLALYELDEAQRLDPSEPSVYANRHVANKGLGKFKSAKNDLEIAISMEPSLPNYYNLAVLERLSGDEQKCIKLLNSILDKSPTHLPSLEQRGLCFAEAGLHELSMKDMLVVFNIDPTNINALRQLGLSLVKKGDIKNGVKYLEKLSEILLAQGNIIDYQKNLDLISSFK